MTDLERRKALRDKRRNNHMCVYCGIQLPDDVDTVGCDICREKKNRQARNRAKRRKENGLCCTCGKKLTTETTKECYSCAEKRRKTTQETKDFCRTMNICPRCCKNQAAIGFVRCPECIEKSSKYDRKKYTINREITLQRNRDKSRKRYYEDKENGKCVVCHHANALPGTTRCVSCTNKRKAYERNKKLEQGKIPRSIWIENGLCYYCGKEVDRDGKLCQSCCEKIKDNLPKEKIKHETWIMGNKLLFKDYNYKDLIATGGEKVAQGNTKNG